MRGTETDIGGMNRRFHPTAWTQIIRARGASSTPARQAWAWLIDAYWKPVYFHVRRKGHDVEEAKDLTQQFFVHFLEQDALRRVDRAKGKFRTFLLTCLDHFLLDEHDRRTALKRRPSFDYATVEGQYSDINTFERDWAMTVLDRAFVRFKAAAPREARILEVQRSGDARYQDLARDLGMSEGNVKVMAHRGRRRLRELLLEELRATVARPGEEQEELKALFRAFSL